ncbi:MAG: HAD-IC family P-type ATPase [bacterium]|nr:HAD-IC family P-type ATPase [bacterium]
MYNGLSKSEVNARIEKGLQNKYKNTHSSSIKDIVIKNTFTFFNFINLVLGILVLISGSPINALFMFVIIFNTLIAIVQEIKSKQIIDKLELSIQPLVKVVRNGKIQEIAAEEIVIDDLLIFRSGDQVMVDTKLVSSDMCEVDESIVTGESKAIIKKEKDSLLSGSFIVSGSCKARVTSIGDMTFASTLIKNAKNILDEQTYLTTMINKLLKIITIAIIPISIALFISQLFFTNQLWNVALLSIVSGIIGMIPEGLVLLTSVSLIAGVMKIAEKNTIIQKLNGIETLSLVDILCFDKTGTITDGTLEVINVVNLDKNNDINLIINSILSDYLTNATDIALSKYFKHNKKLTVIKKIPFSSHRKYASITTNDNTTYAIGALEYIVKKPNQYFKYIDEYKKQGYRVLTLAKSETKTSTIHLPNDISPIAFIIIKDKIRSNAKETIKYFYEQGVNLKIISGDDAQTVSNIAKIIKFKGYDKYINGFDLPSDYEQLKQVINNYNIFGRTNPYQKQTIIKILKETNTVGMVGDGVNDILALKESNCSIALASGISAAKSVSQIVLIDSDFAVLPSIVNEGRRVVNNITRVASLYLIKTTFSLILSILSIFFSIEYPFYPIHLTLISSICVGIPSFFLALEPNNNKIKNSFIIKVFRNAIPTGIVIAFNVLILHILCNIFHTNVLEFRTVIVTITGLLHLNVLYRISTPLTSMRKILIITCLIVFLSSVVILSSFLSLPSFTIITIIIIIAYLIIDNILINLLTQLYDRIIKNLRFNA